MNKAFIALCFLSTSAFAAPVCIVSELGSDDVQMSNTKSTTVELYAEDDKLKEFGSILYPEFSFKANHYGSTLYVGMYKGGKELARSGGKEWTQLVSKQEGKNPFAVLIVDCYAKDPSQKSATTTPTAAIGTKPEAAAPNAYAGTYAAPSCPDGSILTQYGCLPIDTKVCPSIQGQSYALYNNMCVPALNGQYGNYNFNPSNGHPNGYGYYY